MKAITIEECRSRLMHGLIPAVPVPFTVAGDIDSAGQQSYIEHMARQPVAGVAVWAHTGRGLRLSHEQRLQVLRSWSAGLGADKLVIAGVGGSPEEAHDWPAYMASAVAMAHAAAENGAHALLVHPPRLFHHVTDINSLALEYHQQLAAMRVPMILFYFYEAAGGMPYPPELLRQLLALPEVIGIKLATLDSVMTYQSVAQLLEKEFPQAILITGEDRFFGYSLMCGARAALVGMGAACTTLQHSMMRAWFEGRASEFLNLSQAVDRLGRALFVHPMEGYIRRALWALVHVGVLGRESANDPWGPELPESEFVELGETLRALGEIPVS